MKNINTKKVVAGVAALGLSALLAGSVVAQNVGGDNFSMDITKDSLFNMSGVPNVSIVVGSAGQPVDVVWAGNIAAAIGKKAYATTGSEGGAATFNNVTVEVGAEGTSTVSGDGWLLDSSSAVMGAAASNLVKTGIRNRDYSVLFDDELEYRDWDRKTQTITRVKEEMDFEIADVYFESDVDVQEIIAKIGTGKLKYTLDLGSDIVFWAGSPAEEKLTVGGRHSIEIPFLGKMYNIRSVSATGGNAGDISEIELVSADNTIIYNQGDDFTVEGYTVNIGTITDGSNNRVLLRLYEGTTLLKSESLEGGEATDFGYLDEDITVVDVQYASDQMGYVEISKAEGVLKLEPGQMDDLTTDGREWEVAFQASGGKLEGITLTNLDGWTDVLDSDEFPALRIGEKAYFPGDIGAVEFVGLKEEARYPFMTERSSSLTPLSTLVFNWESDDAMHSIPAFASRSINDASNGSKRTMNVELDGKDIWVTYVYNSDPADARYQFREINDDTSTDILDHLYVLKGVVDSNEITNLAYCEVEDHTTLANGNFVKIRSDVDDNVYHYYYLDRFNSNNDFGMALSVGYTPKGVEATACGGDALTHAQLTHNDADVTDTAGYYKIGDTSSGNNTWAFTGTYDNYNTTNKKMYYIGDADKIDEDNVGVATVVINDFGKDITMHFDAEQNRLANLEDLKDGALRTAILSKRKVDYAGGSGYAFVLNDDDSDDLREGITRSGAQLSIEGKQLDFSFPEEVQRVHFFVGGGAESSTTLTGGELVLSTVGTVVETEDGKVSAKLVDYSVSGGTTGTAMVPANWNANTQRIVFLDNESVASAGPKIIVGGHLVNSLASGITDELLVQDGQFVVGATGTGNIVVAGWNANDTANAAKELINKIETM